MANSRVTTFVLQKLMLQNSGRSSLEISKYHFAVMDSANIDWAKLCASDNEMNCFQLHIFHECLTIFLLLKYYGNGTFQDSAMRN